MTHRLTLRPRLQGLLSLVLLMTGTAACGVGYVQEGVFPALESETTELVGGRPRFGIEIETGWLTGFSFVECSDAYSRSFLNLTHEEGLGLPLEGRPWFAEAFLAPPVQPYAGLQGTGWTSTCDISVRWQVEGQIEPRFGDELVSPILAHADRGVVGIVARAASEAGGAPTHGSGIHVHIGSEDMSLDALMHLLKLVGTHQDALYSLLKIAPHRAETYAQPMRAELYEALEAKRPSSRAALVDLFVKHQPYHRTGLDLSPLFKKGTVEFRYFNASLDPKVIALYIDTAYALIDQARSAGTFTEADWARLTELRPAGSEAFLALLDPTGDDLGPRFRAFARRSPESLGLAFQDDPALAASEWPKVVHPD